MDQKTYAPTNGTALLDAVGKAISTVNQRYATMDEKERPNKVLFVIMTDGQENESREFKLDQVKKMIKDQTEKSWGFVFLGADQDRFQGESLGLSSGQVFTYASGAQGAMGAQGPQGMTGTVYDALSRLTRNFVEMDVCEASAGSPTACSLNANFSSSMQEEIEKLIKADLTPC